LGKTYKFYFQSRSPHGELIKGRNECLGLHKFVLRIDQFQTLADFKLFQRLSTPNAPYKIMIDTMTFTRVASIPNPWFRADAMLLFYILQENISINLLRYVGVGGIAVGSDIAIKLEGRGFDSLWSHCGFSLT
jgi:hypothetical protein